MTRQIPVALACVILLCNCSFSAENLPEPISSEDYRSASEAQIKLGQLLFYDRILSGSYRVSCATCHNHDRASSNGYLLAGKRELKPDDLAVNGLPIYDVFKPSSRHAPALFNVGAKEFQTLFSDGRVGRNEDGSFIAPVGVNAENKLPTGLQDVLAVQALFPAVTGDELVGSVESELKTAAHIGNRAIWDALAHRIQELPDYLPYFERAYRKVTRKEDINISQIANAISAFVGSEWVSRQSPFDAYVAGDKLALSGSQLRGMELFYGKAQCVTCHSGKFQTDHKFYNIAMPVWRFDENTSMDIRKRLAGRFGVTGNSQDRYRRRTPSLRNVAATGPYGSFGGIETLDAVVRHHLNPVESLRQLERIRAGKGLNLVVEELLWRIDIDQVLLNAEEVDDLVSFLESLTDQNSLAGRMGKPTSVPSSLALD